jgi:hypothetical protein
MPAALGGRAIYFEIHKLIHSIWKKEELQEEWKESIIVSIYKKGEKTDCCNYRGIPNLTTKYKILYKILLSRLTQYGKEITGGSCVDFDATDQLLIIYSTLIKYLIRNWNTMKQCISCL